MQNGFKARNRFQRDGKLNTRYNLGTNAYSKAAASEKKFEAKAYWMAIQFDKKTYSIYFGPLDELKGSNAIPVDKCAKGEVGDIWESNKRHYFDFNFYSNNK